MDNFVYEEEILLDEDGIPVEIYADEPEETTRFGRRQIPKRRQRR